MNNSRPVYSTDGGAVDSIKSEPPSPNRLAGQKKNSPKTAAKPYVPDDGVVRLFREKGSRGGKTVTVIRGLPERGDALEARAGELKRLCGAGGTVRENAIEIQGDHRERLADRLKALGYRVKIAGG